MPPFGKILAMISRHKIQKEKANIVEAYRAYLATRPPLDEVLGEMKEGLEQLNHLDELLFTKALMQHAVRLDIEFPENPGYWKFVEPFGERALTPTGRNAVRKMIDVEKARRLEVKFRWLKLLIPIITALAALVGAAPASSWPSRNEIPRFVKRRIRNGPLRRTLAK